MRPHKQQEHHNFHFPGHQKSSCQGTVRWTNPQSPLAWSTDWALRYDGFFLSYCMVLGRLRSFKDKTNKGQSSMYCISPFFFSIFTYDVPVIENAQVFLFANNTLYYTHEIIMDNYLSTTSIVHNGDHEMNKNITMFLK